MANAMLGSKEGRVVPKPEKKEEHWYDGINAILGNIRKAIKDKGEEFGKKRGVGTKQYPSQ